MNPQPTFQTLPLECLLEILQYVPLPECMIFRSSCRHLKTAVDEHFRTDVRTLPVLLTTNEKQAARQFLLRKNYLSVWDPDLKFYKFLTFIDKYLPKITKLSLVIDDSHYLANVFKILDVYWNQLTVLSLELASDYEIEALIRRELPKLEELSVFYLNFATFTAIGTLKFSSLKNIHCSKINQHLYRDGSIQSNHNETVELIEIDKLYQYDYKAFIKFLDVFKNLKRVTVLDPSIELTENDFPLSDECMFELSRTIKSLKRVIQAAGYFSRN